MVHARKSFSPCPQILINGDDSLALSPNEITLICGDPNDPAYKNIPLYQANLYLAGFLQARGYLNFISEIKDNQLYIETKNKTLIRTTKISALSQISADDLALFQEHLDVQFVGKTLTPQELNTMEADVTRLLKERGYACADISSKALASNGLVSVVIENTDPMVFGNLVTEKLKGINPRAFERLYPFKTGASYDIKKLELTEKRFLRSGIVEGSYFQETCRSPYVDLEHRLLEGPPRLVRLGIGLSTEVGPMTRARWSHQRKGSMASYRELNLQASFKDQQARALMDEYLWEDSPRRSLLASVEWRREAQEDYEEMLFTIRPHVKWSVDSKNHNWQWILGPTFSVGRFSTDNIEASDQENYSSTSLEGQIQTMSHTFEYYDFHQQEGHKISLNVDLRHPDLGFKEPLALGQLSALKIRPFTRLGKGFLIGAFRTNFSSTWVEPNVELEALPPSVKHFGGGSDDIRGYRLNTLPKNDGLGALTKLGVKMELRKTHTFISTLESVVFLDLMKFGAKPFELDETIWYSPGLGLRWLSPIGLIQGYMAKGLASRPKRDDGPLFFIGIGGQF